FNLSDLRANDTTWRVIGDIDLDGVGEEVRLDNSTGDLYFMLKLSGQRRTVGINLSGYNFTEGNYVKIEDLELYDPVSEDIWGFIQVVGNVSEDNSFVGLDARLSEFPRLPEHQLCTFENLIPERYYCIQISFGKNQDVILESGEIFKVLYKLKPANQLGQDEDFGFKFIPKRGQETEISLSTPDVLVSQTEMLYPR
ncbi:MAG: hypothetical protein QW524_02865, partial [Candidatus Woesearchaeota archaeon]